VLRRPIEITPRKLPQQSLTGMSALGDSVEKVPSLKSLQICQNTIDIFD
jgi:hypothetical protein